MDKKERVLAAIRHEEPDKVPKGELGIAADLMERLIGAKPENEYSGLRRCLEMLKMDLINTALTAPKPKEIGTAPDGKTVYEDQWGMKLTYTDASTHWDPAILDPEDIWSYEVPKPELYKPEDTEYWAKESDYFVFGQTGGCHDNVLSLLGWENAMIASQTDLPAVKDLARRVGELHLELGKMMVEVGADLILVGDDLAFNTGTFFAPESLREWVFPVHEQIVRGIKRLGVPVMLHSDGNLNSVMDDIVDCGYDALQSLQPSAGMDIAEIKRRYGDKLCLMGNLDLDYLMPLGTPDEVRAGVRDVIRKAAHGGGFILSTCNILTRDIPAENAIAMYDEAERFGVYPIEEE
jgi:uroporphyrinogen decarboxylase